MGIPIPIGGGRGGIVGIIIAVLVALVGGGFPQRRHERRRRRAGRQHLAGAEVLGAGRAGSSTAATRSTSTRSRRTGVPPCRRRSASRPSKTVFFSQNVSPACGAADSGVGPFYCPADDLVYIDLSFYKLLADQLGAEGEFAQPYVLAHEYGHHVQDLLGTEAQMRRQQQRDPQSANALSVKLELQADCYAGAWAKNATGTADDKGQKIFTSITEQDISQAIDTAEKIGDDAIQQRSGRPVNPDEFTHGSSEQRKQWFTKGFTTGDPKSCDTFGSGA
ncbi:neutral zinc metallopeptidase [Micromonospora sp. BRA006-A]|nr:neutral zinc metallopeptidase [Micromonospora sp. BRA006-A]